MALTTSIKRAPRWAWFTVAGVSAGAIGIKLWKDRAAEPSDTGGDGTEVGTPAYGPSGSPTPVITPPVIIGGNSGDDGGLSQFAAILGGSFDNLVTSVTDLAAGDQAITGQLAGNITDIATSSIANAGSAPVPYSGSPIVVTIPGPSGGGPAPSIPKPKGCPSAFPKHNPKNGPPGPNSCYKSGYHETCRNHKKVKDNGNRYQNGKWVHTSYTNLGGHC